MKKLLSLLIITVIIVFSTQVLASDIKIFVNGEELVSDVAPILSKDRVMIPFRLIFNKLGVPDEQIEWIEDSNCIQVRSDEGYIFLVIGSPLAIVNDVASQMDVAPFIVNDRTLVPLRFVSEALKATVDWDGDTNTVNITK